MEPYRPQAWQRLAQRIAAVRPVTWFFSLILPWIDQRIIAASKGRSSLTSLLAGFPIVTLHTTGAKTGQPRRSPLVGIPFRDGSYILIASNWGQLHHPAWYRNLSVHPRVALTVDGAVREYLAHETTGAEREECWRRAVEVYAGYEAYRARAGNRIIPVIVLTPAA
ncbi:MAG: nitroreductase/quinone reductase family protein [Acidobacteriota bacterium]|jgi:deazaflavin-dependent oxidoreductase (nitroreductase family)